MNETQRIRPPVEDLKLPAPEWILDKTSDGRSYVKAAEQIRLVDETFGSEGWKAEIAAPAKVVGDEKFTTRKGNEMRAIIATAGARIVVQTSAGEIIRESIGASTSRQETATNNGVDVFEQVMKTCWTNARKRAFSDLGKRFGAGVASLSLAQLQSNAHDVAVEGMQRADKLLLQLEAQLKATVEAKNEELFRQTRQRMRETLMRAAHVNPRSSEQWKTDWVNRMRVAFQSPAAS